MREVNLVVIGSQILRRGHHPHCLPHLLHSAGLLLISFEIMLLLNTLSLTPLAAFDSSTLPFFFLRKSAAVAFFSGPSVIIRAYLDPLILIRCLFNFCDSWSESAALLFLLQIIGEDVGVLRWRLCCINWVDDPQFTCCFAIGVLLAPILLFALITGK